ncbi:RDD family protein [Actinomadura hibisca]|uniref:RDD family protein n=1 Tax=Actinomadura hibisca TaxID=68565 RepID=UPI0008352C5E|nr:RDD family protein [Actinomadura hibisca]
MQPFEAPAQHAAPLPPPARSRRLAAWSIDAALLAVIAVLLAGATWGRLQEQLAGDVTQSVSGAVFGLFASGGDVGKAAGEVGGQVWGSATVAIQQALALLVLAELLHQFAGNAWRGRTIGKALLDIRVRPAKATADAPSGTGKGRAARRALVSTASGTGLYALAWVMLLEGLFFLALMTWLAAVALFTANALPTLAGKRRRSLADRVAGTAVVPARSYQRAAQAVRQGANVAWDGTQAGVQAARDNAARLAAGDRLRQARESERARQAQELAQRAGRQTAERVRGAMDSDRGRQAQEAGKKLGGRLKNAYKDRRPGQPAVQPPAQPALPPPQPYLNPADLYQTPDYAPQPPSAMPPPAPPVPPPHQPPAGY